MASAKVIVAKNTRTKRFVVMFYHPEERPPCCIYRSFTSKRQAMRYARKMAKKMDVRVEDRTRKRGRKRGRKRKRR